MHLKKWPNWIKGLLIFGFIFLPGFWVTENTQWLFIPLLFIWYILGFSFVNHLTFLLVGGTDATAGQLADVPRFISWVILILIYMTLGAILGWIYDKSKNQKRSSGA